MQSAIQTGSYGENAIKKQMLLLGQIDKTGIGSMAYIKVLYYQC